MARFPRGKGNGAALKKTNFEESADLFDSYVDWERRLAREIPFLVEVLRTEAAAERIADVACGTGMHAVALAKEGFQVTGFDRDAALLREAGRRARGSARRSDLSLQVEWTRASFATLPDRAGSSSFDSVLCLGNSIALIPAEELPAAMANMAGMLRHGGVLVAHTINFPLLAGRAEDPWGPVRQFDDGTLLLKGFVPREGSPWDVIFISLKPGDERGTMGRSVSRFQVHPHSREAVVDASEQAGLATLGIHGGFAGEAPDDPRSADLVYLFRRVTR